MDGEWGDNFLNLEGTMVFMVQFFRGATRFDVAATEHYQVSYLMCWRFLSGRIGVLAHSLLCFF